MAELSPDTGADGTRGRNFVITRNGSERPCPGKATLALESGEVVGAEILGRWKPGKRL